jgi:hypothetical protein
MKEKKYLIDRWSVIFVLALLSIISFFIIARKIDIKYAPIPSAITSILAIIVACSSARIRKNEYKGKILYKAENDCGFSPKVSTKIDGVLIVKESSKEVFKAPNGTDIKIDKNGNVTYVGFGSKIISNTLRAGYLTKKLGECWEEKNE